MFRLNTNPASELTRILNTLDLERNAIADPAERAEMAHEVGTVRSGAGLCHRLAAPDRHDTAGQLHDRAEVQRHIDAAWRAAEEFPADLRLHTQTFGPANTAKHVLAAEADLGRPHEVIRLADALNRNHTELMPAKLVDVHTDTARAHLDLGDRDGALTSLLKAWDVAPQKAKVEPMTREVPRVLICLHQRSNPQLVRLAQRAGLTG